MGVMLNRSGLKNLGPEKLGPERLGPERQAIQQTTPSVLFPRYVIYERRLKKYQSTRDKK